jgi:hypothetical protein
MNAKPYDQGSEVVFIKKEKDENSLEPL